MLVVSAGWVLPVSGAPIAGGRVAVESGRVAWVGRAGAPGDPGGPVRDLGPGVLRPGLVNAHCHLELSHLAGEVPFGGGFVAWVEEVVNARGRFGEDQVAEATKAAIRFLEERATVAVGDVSNALAHVGALAGSRLDAVVNLELLAWDPARAEPSLAWAEERVRAVGAWLRPGFEVRLAAHAPHSVSPALFARLRERDGPAAVHLAESPDESRFLADGGGPWRGFLGRRGLGHVPFEAPGRSPVRYLEDLGVLHPRLVAAHAVQLDADDRAVLARRGVHVVLCPRSNRNLGVGVADVPALLAAGVRLALGTDSLASTETLDVLDDAVALHRAFPSVAPPVFLRLATLGGAEALGFAHLGAIAPGRAAALAYAPAATVPAEPHEHVLSGDVRLSRVEVPS
jgi:cytosine/adenosine deaminase-related metal-dependent hydrolase